MTEELSCAGGRLPNFDVQGEGAHPAADTRLKLRHLRLELALDLDRRSFTGRAWLTIEATAAGVRELGLDAVELTTAQVRVRGKPATFRAEERRLVVALPDEPVPGTPFDVEIEYSATPRFGLFFLGPDAGYPERPRQVWSQGQDDYSRYWYPCLDAPNQKATSELVVDVPAPLEVVSNGRLVGREELPGGRLRWHWQHATPHSPYLVSMVAGEFESWRDEHDGVALSYHVPKGRLADGHRSFDRTGQMVRFFADFTGQPYPYPKYSQVCVADFIFGGMENTSATTLTDRTLHDARAHLDHSSEPLVAHELAHQWFGDLLTCRSWSHGWLNEGFATYFEHLWTEQSQGRDELDAELAATADGYFDEDGSRYRRPIVESRYHTASDLFDRTLYNKGAWVLHMLRAELGDDGFRAAIRAYVAANKHGVVETVDLVRAVERATGRNLDPFFDQWVHRAGHPELKVSMEPLTTGLAISVSQTGEAFRFDLELRTDASERVVKLPVRSKESVFEIPLPARPRWAALDPRGVLLHQGEVKKPLELWLAELREGPAAIVRGRAAKALGKAVAVGAVPALREALLKDPFWWVQAQAAAALGEIRGPEALAALGEGSSVTHPKARRGVVRALGQFRDPRAAELLQAPAASDASYLVEGEALKALARTRQPGTRETVIAALPREGFNGTVRAMALDGLGESRDAAALPVVLERLRYGEPVAARVAATTALGKLAEGPRKAEVVDRLGQLLDDPDFYVRLAACDAVAEAQADGARAALDRLLKRDPSGRVQRHALEALARLRGEGETSSNPGGLRADLDALRSEVAGLRQEVARLKNR